MSTTILITGAGGFLGAKLAPIIASLPSFSQGSQLQFILADVQEPKQPAFADSVAHKPKVITQKIDLTKDEAVEGLFKTEFGRPDVIYCMHGIMSLGSEGERG